MLRIFVVTELIVLTVIVVRAALTVEACLTACDAVNDQPFVGANEAQDKPRVRPQYARDDLHVAS